MYYGREITVLYSQIHCILLMYFADLHIVKFGSIQYEWILYLSLLGIGSVGYREVLLL